MSQSNFKQHISPIIQQSTRRYGWLKLQKTYAKHKFKLIWELQDFREVFEQWQHLRMRKHIAWVTEPNDVIPEGLLPPTPRQQIDAISAFFKDHHPTFTEHAILAPRWTDDQMLHIKIPQGLTKSERQKITNAITNLINCSNLSPNKPPLFGKTPTQ